MDATTATATDTELREAVARLREEVEQLHVKLDRLADTVSALHQELRHLYEAEQYAS